MSVSLSLLLVMSRPRVSAETHRHLWSRLILVTAALAITGCAGMDHEFDTAGVDPRLTPARALASPPAALGKKVLWGGTIIATRNLTTGTQVEVLAYPLEPRSAQPRISEAPGERFLALHPAFLEPATHAPGRMVTVLGVVESTREGVVGEARYVYPVLSVRDLYLWPKDGQRNKPQLHFGIGIGISR